MVISASHGRSTRTFRRQRARLLTESDICAICAHPGAQTAGHIISRAVAPDLAEDPDNLVPLHGATNRCPTCGRNCNGEQGTQPLASMNQLKTSRDWFIS